MKLWVYVLPLPICAASFTYWNNKTETFLFALFIIALPTLYGYIIPGIATNVMKKWRFHGKFLLGRYYLHHGFKYASNMNICFFIAFGDAFATTSISLHRYISIALCTAFIQAFLIWIHDTHCIKLGMLEINNPFSRSGKSAEEISFQYAPLTFFLIGLTFSISTLCAYQFLVINNNSTWSIFFYCLLAGFILMASIPSLIFGLIERRWKMIQIEHHSHN